VFCISFVIFWEIAYIFLVFFNKSGLTKIEINIFSYILTIMLYFMSMILYTKLLFADPGIQKKSHNKKITVFSEQ